MLPQPSDEMPASADQQQGSHVHPPHMRPAPMGSTTKDIVDEMSLEDDWLHDFYKECGREVTLAYTTLNQMKNWAIAIQAALIAAVVSLTRPTPGGAAGQVELAMLVAAVLAFLYTLRFFVRAILCYINLLRWNRLQSGIVALRLMKGLSATQSLEAEKRLIRDIQTFYHGWKATVPRAVQLVANLKLGFGLLLATPLLVMIYCAIVLPVSSLAVGFVAFGVGGTVIEAIDFFSNRYFDDPARSAMRRPTKEQVFPTPQSRKWYVWSWVVNLGISALLAWLVS